MCTAGKTMDLHAKHHSPARSHLDEPIEGWRVWNLTERCGPSPLPAGSGVDHWQPRRASEARCAVPVSSVRVSARTRLRISAADAVSTPADRSTYSIDRGPHGRRPPSSARFRCGARSSNTNGDGGADSRIRRGSASSAPCVRGSSREPAYRRSCTPSGHVCTRSARTIEVASKCPTGEGRDPRDWTHGRSNPDSSRRTRSISSQKRPFDRSSRDRHGGPTLLPFDQRRAGLRSRRPRRTERDRRLPLVPRLAEASAAGLQQ